MCAHIDLQISFFFIYKTNLVLFEAAVCRCAVPDTESVLQFSGNTMGSTSSQENPHLFAPARFS